MPERREATVYRPPRFGLDTGAFFLLFYLYAWLVIDPRLVHHSMGFLTPYFSVSIRTGWPFFQEHLFRPGGLVEYAARCFAMLFSIGWLGALIMTAVAWSTCLATDAIARRDGHPRGMIIRFIPALVLLVMYGQYSYPLEVVLSLLVALAGFVLYQHFFPNRTLLAAVVLALFSAIIYYVAGVACAVFLLLVAIDAVLLKRGNLRLLMAFACGAGVPLLIGRSLLQVPFDRVYGMPTAAHVSVSVWNSSYAVLLYLCCPAVLIGVSLHRGLMNRPTSRSPAGKRKVSDASSPKGMFSRLHWIRDERVMRMLAVCLTGAIVASQAIHWQGKAALQFDYYCQHGKWPQALETARRMPTKVYNTRVNRNIMLTLYHTRRLGDEMFSYPQTKSNAVYHLLGGNQHVQSRFQDSRFFLELGQVNLAEKSAYEALGGTGEMPAILELLAKIHIVKGQPETAKVHLHALRNQLFHAHAAEEMLARIAEDPRLDSDPDVQQIRRCAIRQDDATLAVDIERSLLGLLETNPDNRMAFEFLLAHYLCNLRPDQVVEKLPNLERFGYIEVPRHFQEAIIVHANTKGEQIPASDPRLAAETVQRAELFFSILASSPNREKAMEVARHVGLGDSYFFFYCFGESGM